MAQIVPNLQGNEVRERSDKSEDDDETTLKGNARVSSFSWHGRLTFTSMRARREKAALLGSTAKISQFGFI